MRKAAIKFGKHPVMVFKNDSGENSGLNTVLFRVTNPYNNPKSIRLIPRILCCVLRFIQRVLLKQSKPFNGTTIKTIE